MSHFLVILTRSSDILAHIFNAGNRLIFDWNLHPQTYVYCRYAVLFDFCLITLAIRKSIHMLKQYDPLHEISNNVGYATNNDSDQPSHIPNLIRVFASYLNVI